MIRFFIAVLSISLVACSESHLPKVVALQSLRVLAMTADFPEINFDGTSFNPGSIQVTPWISDLYGSGRALSYNVYGCLDPGIGTGVTPTCTQNPTLLSIVQNGSVASTSTFLAPNFTGSLNAETVNFGSLSASALAALQVQFSQLTIIQKFNGYSFLIFFEVWPSANPELKVTTFKRIVLSDSSKTVKNINPTGLEIRLDSTEITALPTTEIQLNAFLPAPSAETYSFYDSSGTLLTQTELLTVGWYLTAPQDIDCSKKKECSTDGLFHLSFSNASQLNRFFPPKVPLPTNRGRVLISTVQDGRGGSMVKRYCDGVFCP